MNSLAPANITAAAVLAQFLILLILVISSQIMGRLYELWVPFFRRDARQSSYSLLLLVLTLTTLGAFFFSDVFVELWRPLFGNKEFLYISWSSAIKLFFLLDIACITTLVMSSGGPRVSPFAALYGLMPVIALFLLESVFWVAIYSGLVVLGITISLFFTQKVAREENGVIRDPLAFWFVNVSTIALATFIGVVTRT
jgi:hypothetical protein